MKTYKTITSASMRGVYDYNTGMSLESNGKRFRVTRWGFRWHGNEGGSYTETHFADRQTGRKMLKIWRQAVIAKMSDKWHEYEYAIRQLGAPGACI